MPFLTDQISYYYDVITREHVHGDVTGILEQMLTLNRAFSHTTAYLTRNRLINSLEAGIRDSLTIDRLHVEKYCADVKHVLGGIWVWSIRNGDQRTYCDRLPWMSRVRVRQAAPGRLRRIDGWLSVDEELARVLDARHEPMVINKAGCFYGYERDQDGTIRVLREIARFFALAERVTGEHPSLSQCYHARSCFDSRVFSIEKARVIAGNLQSSNYLPPFRDWMMHASDEEIAAAFGHVKADLVREATSYRLWLSRSDGYRPIQLDLHLAGTDMFLPFEELSLPDKHHVWPQAPAKKVWT